MGVPIVFSSGLVVLNYRYIEFGLFVCGYIGILGNICSGGLGIASFIEDPHQNWYIRKQGKMLRSL